MGQMKINPKLLNFIWSKATEEERDLFGTGWTLDDVDLIYDWEQMVLRRLQNEPD
jgi:hypothetical protein